VKRLEEAYVRSLKKEEEKAEKRKKNNLSPLHFLRAD
jgi:hypothetical protein